MGEPVTHIQTPLTDGRSRSLAAGDRVLLSGVIYTARDAAHARLVELLSQGKPLPVDLNGQVIYYAGPTPRQAGPVIGSLGPTTSGRMDAFTPELLAAGLKGMIGKGLRDASVVEAIEKHKAVYFAATGGAGALLAKCVVSCEVDSVRGPGLRSHPQARGPGPAAYRDQRLPRPRLLQRIHVVTPTNSLAVSDGPE